MPLGLYLSIPFCRTKCSYCNFASDVFSRALFERYVQSVCSDIEQASATAGRMKGCFDTQVDSIYLGGGTPTVLDIAQLERLFVTISQNFEVAAGAEVTVECAPGLLTPSMIEALVRNSVNRVSLGVQSFVDEESRAVGRLHTRQTTLDDIARLRSAGITNLNVDLIAGLPHQTRESWEFSLREVIASEVPHVSVYMLEVDEDSRLGRELIAGGTRYHAHFVPDEELTADFYELACERLNQAGIQQYEISNFARAGQESRHNLKYWQRQPYLGFGVDAHSMLPSLSDPQEAVRLATSDSLDAYMAGTPLQSSTVSTEQALEEEFFLGLRLTRGVNLDTLAERYSGLRAGGYPSTIDDLAEAGFLDRDGSTIRLTSKGRLLSNEVFERFLSVGDPS